MWVRFSVSWERDGVIVERAEEGGTRSRTCSAGVGGVEEAEVEDSDRDSLS